VSVASLSVSTRRRRLADRLGTSLMVVTLLITLIPLAWVLVYVSTQGIRYLSPHFFGQNPPGDPSTPGGGFYNGIIGTCEIVGIAFAMAAPVGIGTAIYLVEYGGTGRFARVVRFLSDVLVGIPSIVIGAFVYSFWVVHFGFSGLAGSIALAIVMLPIVARSSEEMLLLVPDDLRAASYGLGARRWRTVVSVVLPSAWAGITTGLMLAVARAAGETAPLLLTALGNDLFTEYNPSRRMTTLSLQIFGNAITGFRAAQARAWAGALTLIGIVLVLTLAARYLAGRNAARGRT
jgi:phosphate transport system permease protein